MNYETVKAAAEARVVEDNKACDAAWEEVFKHLPEDAKPFSNPDMIRLMRTMFDIGWERGIIYLANNPLPQ